MFDQMPRFCARTVASNRTRICRDLHRFQMLPSLFECVNSGEKSMSRFTRCEVCRHFATLISIAQWGAETRRGVHTEVRHELRPCASQRVDWCLWALHISGTCTGTFTSDVSDVYSAFGSALSFAFPHKPVQPI